MLRLCYSVLALFLSTHVSAQNLGDLQRQQTKEHTQHIEEVKKALRACTSLTQDSDVRGRNMSKNVQLEFGDTCVVQKPSTDGFMILQKQINSAFKTVDVTDLWTDINKIALERTAKSVWAIYMRMIKDVKLTEASALALICKHTPLLCKNAADYQIIKNSFASFQKDIVKTPMKFLTGPEQDAILHTELQPSIARANKTCAATQKKYQEIAIAHSCTILPDFSIKPKDPKVEVKPVKKMTMGECDGRLRQAYLKHKELEKIATESIGLDMQLIVGSQLGSLLITEDLRDKMGILNDDFVFKSCMKGKGSLLNQVWNVDLFKARNDFYALTIKELQKIQSDRTDNFDFTKKQTLKQYLKTNPSTVAELLRLKPDANKAFALCSLVETIQGWDKVNQIVDGVIIGTGLVASVALGCTGIGAPAGGLLAGLVLGSTLLSVSKSALDYGFQIHQDTRLRSAVATRQKNLDQGLADLKVSDERKEGFLDNIKLTVGAEVIGFGIGKGLKLLTKYRQVQGLKKIAPTVSGLNLVDEAAMAKKMEVASVLYQQEVKLLGSKGVHLSKVSIDHEAQLAHLYTNLKPEQAKLLTKKIAGLKTPEEITAFLKAVEQNSDLLAKSSYDIKNLNKLVDASKTNPPMYIKVENSPSTKSLYAKLTVEEQKRMVTVAKDLKKMKLPDSDIFKTLSTIQDSCLVKGVFKRGCFQTQITKFERAIASNAIHEYMQVGHAKILAKSKNTEELIRKSTQPVVYDVVAIGAGPHNGIAINAMKDVDPNLKILVIDKTENLGVFHSMKGFDINTPEYLKQSGNTFPGTPTQLKDFNVKKRIYTTAEELGEQTQAAYQYADVDMVFKNEVMTVSKEPSPGAWPAQWKIETKSGLVVYSRAGISNQGFGDFATRLKDAKSLEIVGKHHSNLKLKNLAEDSKYSPPITSVDDLLPMVNKDVQLGRNGLSRFEDVEDVLVVGAGDGGNIAIETLTGLNKKLNPSGELSKVKVKVKWLSQEAKTGDEFVKTLNERTIKRYSRIGKTIDSGQVEPINGYLSRIEEFTNEAGEIRFKAYYTTKTGEAIGEPIIAKNIVFSTGYPNNESHILPLFNKLAPAENISFMPIKGNIDEFTPYKEFVGEETFTSRQLIVNGEPQNWYSSGVAGKIPASDLEKVGISVGGSIDVLAPKSASTGQLIARQLSPNKVTPLNQTLIASVESPHYFTLKNLPSTKLQYQFDNLAVANIDLKLQVGKSLRGFEFTPDSKFSLIVTKNKNGEYLFEIKGLDKTSAQKIVTQLGKNPDLTHDLNSLYKLGNNKVEIYLSSRSNGLLKLEDLAVNKAPRILTQLEMDIQLSIQKENKLKPLYFQMTQAYEKGSDAKKLRYEIMGLKKITSPTPQDLEKISTLEAKYLKMESEVTVLNDKYLTRMHGLYVKEGIPSKLVKIEDGSLSLVLDFSSPPTKKSAFEFYRKVKNRFGLDKVTLNLKENAMGGSGGFFSRSFNKIDMGPSQGLSLLDDYFNSVSKHESRHLMFYAKRADGTDSIFHARFYASNDGKLLNADKAYDTYMSSEEVYTYSTDMQSFAQVFKDDFVTNLAKREGLVEQITSHQAMFKKVSASTKNVTEEMVNSLDELLKSPNKNGFAVTANDDGTWTMFIKDKLNRQTEITLVSNEEKALAKNLTDMNKKFEEEANLIIEQKLKDLGVDTDALAIKIQNNKMTSEDITMSNKVSEEYFSSTDALAKKKQLDVASVPLIQNAKEMMGQLNKLAGIQLKEADKLESLIKVYTNNETGGQAQQLTSLKNQMFKIAKNVKEDYKGFALKD